MQVKDLSPRMGNVEITLDVTEKGNIREFDKFGKKGRVCNFTCADSTGKISLTLWNDDIDKASVGDIIEIKNGWVGEYQGELQLSTGKFGELILKGKNVGVKETKAELKLSKLENKVEQKPAKKQKEDDDFEAYSDEEVVEDE